MARVGSVRVGEVASEQAKISLLERLDGFSDIAHSKAAADVCQLECWMLVPDKIKPLFLERHQQERLPVELRTALQRGGDKVGRLDHSSAGQVLNEYWFFATQ